MTSQAKSKKEKKIRSCRLLPPVTWVRISNSDWNFRVLVALLNDQVIKSSLNWIKADWGPILVSEAGAVQGKTAKVPFHVAMRSDFEMYLKRSNSEGMFVLNWSQLQKLTLYCFYKPSKILLCTRRSEPISSPISSCQTKWKAKTCGESTWIHFCPIRKWWVNP